MLSKAYSRWKVWKIVGEKQQHKDAFDRKVPVIPFSRSFQTVNLLWDTFLISHCLCRVVCSAALRHWDTGCLQATLEVMTLRIRTPENQQQRNTTVTQKLLSIRRQMSPSHTSALFRLRSLWWTLETKRRKMESWNTDFRWGHQRSSGNGEITSSATAESREFLSGWQNVWRHSVSMVITTFATCSIELS